MAQSKSGRKFMNMVYGLGASIVILGALFKIMHWPFGNEMLILGLVVESLVFAVSAFEPVDDDVDWSLVYPELAGGGTIERGRTTTATAIKEVEETEGMLSKKLDEMLREAKIDSNLMSSLGQSIRNFEGAAKGISPTVDAMASQRKYSEEMTMAAAQMETLNNIYKVQVDSASRQTQINQAVTENAAKLHEQMASLTRNLQSLNGVYGGMLSAMHTKG